MAAIDQLEDFHPSAWTKILLDADFLKSVLKPLVNQETGLERIGSILAELRNARGCLRTWITEQKSDLSLAPRLFVNTQALVASAVAAAAFQGRLVSASMAATIEYLWQTQTLLDPLWTAQKPEGAGSWGSGSFLEFARGLNPQPAAALYWTAYWLGDTSYLRSEPATSSRAGEIAGASGVTHRVQVPIVAFDEEAQKGYPYHLELGAVAGQGSPLFEHPDSALLPVADDWLLTLRRTAGLPARADDPQQPKPGMAHPVCWRIVPPPNVPLAFLPFTGHSHGGAALRAFWHLARRKYPDPRVFVLACFDREGTGWWETPWDKDAQNFSLKPVERVAEKVRAAADQEADTIVVVKEFIPEGTREVTNHTQAQEALTEHPGAAKVRLVELE